MWEVSEPKGTVVLSPDVASIPRELRGVSLGKQARAKHRIRWPWVEVLIDRQHKKLGLRFFDKPTPTTRRVHTSHRSQGVRVHCQHELRRLGAKPGYYPFHRETENFFVVDLANPLAPPAPRPPKQVRDDGS